MAEWPAKATGSGLPAGGSVGQVVVNTAPGAGEWSDSPAPTAANVGAVIAGADAKNAPADADTLALSDATGTPANVLKKLSWAYVKSVLKTYFDGIYHTIGAIDLTTGVTGVLSVANGGFGPPGTCTGAAGGNIYPTSDGTANGTPVTSFFITDLGADAVLKVPSGLVAGQVIRFWIKDNGSAHGLNCTAYKNNAAITLPTASLGVATTWLRMIAEYDGTYLFITGVDTAPTV